MSDDVALNQEDLFRTISTVLSKNYEKKSEKWIGSPFEWLQCLASVTKGTIGEKLVADWARVNGFIVHKRLGSGHDLRINDLKVEVKFSTLWKQDVYKFQQFRDQDYSHVFCLGISPQQVHAWVVPKASMWEIAKGQHGGARARDTKEIFVKPSAPPIELRPYGGTLDEALTLLTGLTTATKSPV